MNNEFAIYERKFHKTKMENIFSTKERIKILKSVVYKTGLISVSNIASELKLSKGLVSKYLDILVKNGVAKRAKGKFVINNSPFTRGIKIILNLMGIDPRIFKKYPFVESVGLYGSCAKGDNNEDSDVDLWVKIKETAEENQAALISELRKKIKNVKTLFLTEEKLGKIKEGDHVFYNSLFFGSITIYGDENGL